MVVRTRRSIGSQVLTTAGLTSAPAGTEIQGDKSLQSRDKFKLKRSAGNHELWRKVFHVTPGLVTYGLYCAGFHTGDVAYAIFVLMVCCAGKWWCFVSYISSSHMGSFTLAFLDTLCASVCIEMF